ncbi:MAG TPA: RsbRD N-terminal domain-containing protein, partial [Cyclobacteriaceae bacterium]|nr:RsbRD N-terminal domain-containing protein [Cyclobacteriaceae bacterium]
MKNESIKIFQKRKIAVLESWMKFQLADEGLREDLISNEELRRQSEEFLNALIDAMKDSNIDDPKHADFEPMLDILSAIAISRAKQGFSPRETGIYIFSLRDALLNVLQQEMKDPQELFTQTLKINKLVDSFGVTTFET